MSHGLDNVEAASQAAPKRNGGALERGLGHLNRVIVIIASVALVVAAFVLTYSVATRYFLHLSTDWQDELSVFLIVGAVFMSSAAVQAHRGHVAIEAVSALLSPRMNEIRLFLVDTASLAFCGFFAWKSWRLLEEAWIEGFRSGSTWGPPLWIPYFLMTAGITLLSLQLLAQVIGHARHRKPGA